MGQNVFIKYCFILINFQIRSHALRYLVWIIISLNRLQLFQKIRNLLVISTKCDI